MFQLVVFFWVFVVFFRCRREMEMRVGERVTAT